MGRPPIQFFGGPQVPLGLRLCADYFRKG